MGVTPLWPMEANSGVRGHVRAAKKAPVWMTDRHTHNLFIIRLLLRRVPGLFVLWTIRTLDCSYHGLFVPLLDDSYHVARLTKINVSYQNVPVYSVSQKSPREFF